MPETIVEVPADVDVLKSEISVVILTVEALRVAFLKAEKALGVDFKLDEATTERLANSIL